MGAEPFHDGMYEEAAQEWDVDPHLLRAVAGQESGHTRDPDRALSPAGARGRMQLMPRTAASMGVTDTSDARQNIFAGARYLSEQLDKYGRPDLALAAYNAGPGRVDDYLAGRGPLPAETRAYVPGVTARYQTISSPRPDMSGNAPRNAQGGGKPSPARVVASGDVSPAQPSPSATAHPYDAAIGSSPSDAADPYAAAVGGQPPAESHPYDLAIAAAPGSPRVAVDDVPGAVVSRGGPPPSVAEDLRLMVGIDQPPPAPRAATPRPAAPPLADRFGPTAGDFLPDQLAAARAADAAKPADQRVREALAPAPGTTYSDVLPLAKDDATGQVRFALPTSARSMLEGLYDATQGPATGTVTPAATEALAGLALGGALNPSVARGTGAAIGSRTFGAGRNENPDFLGATFRANPQDANPLAARPVSGPTSPVPDANPLAPRRDFPSTPAPRPAIEAPPSLAGAAPPPTVNLLSGDAAPIGPAGTPFLPIVTRGQASRQVDNLLAHFGQGGETAPATASISGPSATLAQATGNPGLAALENGLRGKSDQFARAYEARTRERAQARNAEYQRIAGGSGDVEAAEAARDAATASAREAAFSRATPTDAQPFVDTINGILASPEGKRDSVTRTLQPLLDKVKAADGKGLETDPAQLYGVRKSINDQLSSVGTQEGADAKAATRQLLQARKALDGVIEKGAPGFGDYLAQHAEASRPIDAMRWLQAQNVTDTQGNIALGKLDSAIKRAETQRGKPGAGLADSLTDEQLGGMRALRDDMRREAAAAAVEPVPPESINKLAGSKVASAAKFGADAAALAGLISTANPVTYGAGGVPGALARYGVSRLSGRGEALVAEQLRERLLNPRVEQNPLAARLPR